MPTRTVLIIDTALPTSRERITELLHVIGQAAGVPFTLFSNERHDIPAVNLNNLALHLGTTRSLSVIEQKVFNADQIYSLFGALHSLGILVVLTPVPECLTNLFYGYAQLDVFRILTVEDALNSPEKIRLFFRDSASALNEFPASESPHIPEPDLQQKEFISTVTRFLKERDEFVIHLDGARGTGKTTATVKLVDTLVHNMCRCGLFNAGARELASRYTDTSSVFIITDDNVCEYVDKVDLLIVEEAAALPVSVLFSLLKKYKRTVLVTTLSGYEGSAMGLRHQLYAGFGITRIELRNRYRNTYDQAAAILDALFFNSPVINRVNHSPENAPILSDRDQSHADHAIHCLKITNDCAAHRRTFCTVGAELIKSPLGRHVLFLINRLLKTNHYEQTPQDLIRWVIQQKTCLILTFINDDSDAAYGDEKCMRSADGYQEDYDPLHIDSKELDTFRECGVTVGAFPPSPETGSGDTAKADAPEKPAYGDRMILAGVTVATLEGNIDCSLARDIMMGTRQPKDNLCPQTLITQCGLENAGSYSYLRVERIAVIPTWRRKSVASLMVDCLMQTAVSRNIDFLGVSFALSSGTAKFWLANGFVPVNIGLTPDNASGKRSLLMLKDVNGNPNPKTFNAAGAFKLFTRRLPHLIVPFGLTGDADIFAGLDISGVSELFTANSALSFKNADKQHKNTAKILYDKISAECCPENSSEFLGEPSGETDGFMKNRILNVIDSIINGHHSLIHSIYELKTWYLKNPHADRLTEGEKQAFDLFLAYGLTKKEELQHLLKTDGAKSTLRQLRNIIRKMG